jgi:hypothetical protein|tara:strand:- start:247 stop:879 length:633 start_codon:yes stop_codon:yes gene_type:complete
MWLFDRELDSGYTRHRRGYPSFSVAADQCMERLHRLASSTAGHLVKECPEASKFGSSGRYDLEKNELVAILRSDKAEFQRIREQDPTAKIDLSGADLTGCDLAGTSFVGVNLSNACLRNADCTKAAFRGIDLSGADLRGAKLEGANFHQATMDGANLEDATLGSFESPPRMCLHADSFRQVRWSRGQLEMMLRILNENASFEIRYELVAK